MKLGAIFSRNLFIFYIFAFIPLLSSVPYAEGSCATIAVRKEIRQFTTQERIDFINAVKQLNQGVRPSRYDLLTKWHQEATAYAHYQPQFLPWHRAYLREYEKALQSINPNVVIPYWNWSEDYLNPISSPVFSNDWCGGSGSCVSTGPFANWQVTYKDYDQTSPHCLQRSLENLKGYVADPTTIQHIVYSNNRYQDFHPAIEGNPHAGIHNGVGGDMATMAGPNDPIFYMHHAYIDKIWADWQKRDPLYVYQYGGTNKDGSRVYISDYLKPFNIQVASVMPTTSDNLCYVYQDYPETTMTSQSIIDDEGATQNKSKPPRPKPAIIPKLKRQPDSWILMMGGNITQVREQENKLFKFIDQFNLNVTLNRPLRIDIKIH
ncbi:uncharacterized protein VTP21DRAFT_5343 [Calcarisporiella thermophila]|uniref:uncharacterized protein n=1 Tax=Calcarisporiella thermophila TaxID=911321 RepID=UPI003742EA80